MDADLRAALERHQQRSDGRPECRWCFCAWPCDTACALVALDAADSQVAALVEALTGAADDAEEEGARQGNFGDTRYRALLADLAPAAAARDAALIADWLTVDRIAAALLDGGLVTTLDVGRNWAPRVRDALLSSETPKDGENRGPA